MKVRRGYFFIGVGVFMFLFLFFTVHEAYYGAFYKAGRVAFSEKRYATAISAYEKAEPLWLTRRLFYDESAAYLRRYEETRNSLFLEQGIKLLFRATQENPFDAFMLNSYAETAYDHGKISMTEAISYYLKAIHLDSKNNLAYYRNLLSAYIAEGERKAFLEWEPRVSMLLERYSDQLRDNEHLTVLTDNPRYAFEIYGLLARQALSPGKRSEYLQKEADIRTFFVKKYTEMADVFDLEPLNVIF